VCFFAWKVPSEFADFLDAAGVKKIRDLSIEDARTLDLQIEIFAYWKVCVCDGESLCAP
jgi:hypothetical protein